ncbi:TonB-dependent receptor [Thauera sp.]
MKPTAYLRLPSAQRLRRSVLATAVAAACAGLAHAQEAATVLPQITVTGQAASIDSALDVQQMSDNIISVIHSDAIGELPDANAAEALQRVPGVSVERDQGEGRYVRVRGLGPDLNTVTINGSLVPSPEADRRAVSLDVLPSGLIRSIEVYKTLSPEHDANSIGGTIEIKTLSAFDNPGQFWSLDVGAGHDTNVDKTSPEFAAAWSNRFADGKLGVAAGINYSRREFGSDNVETGGDWTFSGDDVRLGRFQRRDYNITRERVGGILNIDYRPQEGESYYLRTIVSRYEDDEVRQRHNVRFSSALLSGQTGQIRSSRELKARTETQSLASVVFGTEQTLGDWTTKLQGGISRAAEKTPGAIDSAAFTGGRYPGGFTSTRVPTLFGDAAINDPAEYELSRIGMSSSSAADRERNLRLDFDRHLSLLGMDSELKFGAKLSRREKTNSETVWDIDGAAFDNPLLSDYSTAVDYHWGNFGPGISPSRIRSLLKGVDRSAYLDEEASRIGDFTMNEDINSAYVQNTFRSGPWSVLAGVRYEGTRFKAKGTGLENGVFVDVQDSNRYDHWLPALHARYDLDNDTSVRGALTYSVVRPTFEQLAPGYLIDGDEAEFGNPDLKPTRSRNVDLGIERRLGYAGTVSAYVFHKRIKDFVYATDVAGTGAWAAFDEAVTFENGSKARVSGLELNYIQSFSHLPAPWNRFLFGANATFSDSSARIEGLGASRNIPLPSQSDRSFNLMVGYEHGPLSMRLAANHKSGYLLEVNDIADKRYDDYVSAQTFYDFSLRYSLTERAQIVFEALNLSDEKYHVGTGRAALNAQHERYGRAYKLGLKLAMF